MSSIRRCELVTRLYRNDGTTIISIDKIKEIIEKHLKCIQDFCYIVHDKDTYTEEDEEMNPAHKAGTLKPSHVHILLRFYEKYPQDSVFVAKWFGVPENFINKVKGRWDYALLYQIHYNAVEKYQYDVSEVYASFDYADFIKQYAERNLSIKTQRDIAIQKILNGEIREYNSKR